MNVYKRKLLNRQVARRSPATYIVYRTWVRVSDRASVCVSARVRVRKPLVVRVCPCRSTMTVFARVVHTDRVWPCLTVFDRSWPSLTVSSQRPVGEPCDGCESCNECVSARRVQDAHVASMDNLLFIVSFHFWKVHKAYRFYSSSMFKSHNMFTNRFL